MYRILGKENKVHGPLSASQMLAEVRAGHVTPATLVSRGGARWRLAFSLPELRPLFLRYRAMHEPLISHLLQAQTMFRDTKPITKPSPSVAVPTGRSAAAAWLPVDITKFAAAVHLAVNLVFALALNMAS